MTRAFNALTAEPWAITPDALMMMSAIVQRHHNAPVLRDHDEWTKRNYDILAGPTATRLAGSLRTSVIGGVAVIPVTGPIFPRASMMTEMSGATSYSTLTHDLKVAMASEEIGEVVLFMDTPGGTVSGTSAFADLVARMKAKKPITAFVSGQACSAGYWVAAAASEIIGEKTAIVGSIGVVAAMQKQVLPDAMGYIEIEIISSNAPNKRPDPTTEEGVAEVKMTLDFLEKMFVADVAANRNISVDKVLSDFGQGGLKPGSRARDAGMIDHIRGFEATMNDLMRKVSQQKRLAALKQ